MSLMGYYIHLAIGLLLDLWSLIICLFTGVPAMERNNDSNSVCILIPGVFGNAVCFRHLSMKIADPQQITQNADFGTLGGVKVRTPSKNVTQKGLVFRPEMLPNYTQ